MSLSCTYPAVSALAMLWNRSVALRIRLSTAAVRTTSRVAVALACRSSPDIGSDMVWTVGEAAAAKGCFPHPHRDLEQLVGHEAVSLAVHLVGALGRGCLDQAEDLALRLVDPIAQVPHVTGALGRQVSRVG